MAEKARRVWVAGHQGMVGSALCRRLAECPDTELVTRTRQQLNLLRQSEVEDFMAGQEIDEVYLAAAKVGGIAANRDFPASFIYQNLAIQNHVIHACWQAGVSRLMLLGSSCIYPRDSQQPMAEEALLTGPLELTNEPYAVAKIAGIKTCESYNRQYGTDYRCVMPTNLYGPQDNFNLDSSHVLPALLRKFHTATLAKADFVRVWGSGEPRREFMHVDDLADACVFLMRLPRTTWDSETDPRCSHVNVGTGMDLSIRSLAEKIAKLTGYEGRIEFDRSKPDGTLRKLLDTGRLERLGWSARIDLHAGLESAYKWMCDHWQDIEQQ